MELNELWERTCAALMKEINGINYNALIQNNLSPAALEDDTLVLGIAIEQLKPALTSRYLPTIQECVKRVSGEALKVEICTRSELKEREERGRTAMTEEHLQLLWRMTPDPILCFDGDKAGLKADNIVVSFLRGDDPGAEAIAKAGADAGFKSFRGAYFRYDPAKTMQDNLDEIKR